MTAIEQCEREVLALITKLQCNDFTKNAILCDSQNDVFDDLEKEYLKIGKKLSCKLEELTISQDIFEHYNRVTTNTIVDGNTANIGIGASRKKIRKIFLDDLADNFCEFLIGKGKFLFSINQFEKALQKWEFVFKRKPDQEELKSISYEFNAIISKQGLNKAKLNANFIEYAGCFLECDVKNPSGFLLCNDEKTMIISSWFENRVCKLNLANPEDPISLKFAPSLGLAKDSAGKIWLCDFFGQKIIKLNIDGSIEDEIILSEILKKYRIVKYPFRLFIEEDNFYLIITSKDRVNKKLIYFKRSNPEKTISELKFDTLRDVCFLCVEKDTLFFSNNSPPFFVSYDLVLKKFNFIVPFCGLTAARAFVKIENFFYINVDDYLFKLNADGKVIFCYLFNSENLNQETAFYAMNAYSCDGVNYLLALDFTKSCIHKFVI